MTPKGGVPLSEFGSLEAKGHATGSSRSVAVDAQACRVAVHPTTGELRILRSIHAADAARVINTDAVHGQIESGVAQAIGAALYENVIIDEAGRVVTQTFRNYHIPACADAPRTEVLFADADDSVGPLSAKSMSASIGGTRAASAGR